MNKDKALLGQIDLNILRAKLLDPIFLVWTKERYKNITLLDEKTVLKHIKNFKNAWQKNGAHITRKIEEGLSLKFKKRAYDCFVVNRSHRDLSSPLIIKARYTPEEFLSAVAHELVHILFQENNDKISLEDLKTAFETKDDSVARHIPVYAVLLSIKKENVRNKLGRVISKILSIEKPDSAEEKYRIAKKYALEKGERYIFEKIKSAARLSP